MKILQVKGCIENIRSMQILQVKDDEEWERYATSFKKNGICVCQIPEPGTTNQLGNPL